MSSKSHNYKKFFRKYKVIIIFSYLSATTVYDI